MKNKVTLIVALGCVYAGATNSVNYDLLGRRGSKMNSPMVYKKLDHSKTEKQQLTSSLGNQGLKKMASGLSGNVDAMVGAFCNKGLDYSTSYPVPYYMKRYFINGSDQEDYFDSFTGRYGYLNASNSSFIPIERESYNDVSYSLSDETKIDQNVYAFSSSNYAFSNNEMPSPFFNENIKYSAFFNLEYPLSKRASIALWYDAGNYNVCQQCGDVGVYMVADALPVKLNRDSNPAREVKYIAYSPWEWYYTIPTPETEMLSSKTYSVLKRSARNSVVYVGTYAPPNPAHPSWMNVHGPQIYVGLHNRPDVGVDQERAKYYSEAAKNLDNYIYNHRTVEIAAAGNYWSRLNYGHLAAEAHSVNAITVGAVDSSGYIAKYTSDESKLCDRGVNKCNDLASYNLAPTKPEIYNFSHFYMSKETSYPEMNDRKRTYRKKSDNTTYTYYPYYDGTETAASYTAGMVANLLEVNPFYRWHPEVVKALLLASGDVDMKKPYPHKTPATTKMPSYYSTVFDNSYSQYYHYSRYWIGNIEKLKTHVVDNKNEIRFSVKRPAGKTNFSAAIAWLVSGDDIDKVRILPQDIDIIVYERNVDDINSITNSSIGLEGHFSTNNPYEKISFTSSAQYLLFRIKIYRDDERSDNKGQLVLGFDLASGD